MLLQGSYGQGKPEKVREFQNFSKVRDFSKLLKSWRKYSEIKIFENIQKSGNFRNYPEKHGNCI